MSDGVRRCAAPWPRPRPQLCDAPAAAANSAVRSGQERTSAMCTSFATNPPLSNRFRGPGSPAPADAAGHGWSAGGCHTTEQLRSRAARRSGMSGTAASSQPMRPTRGRLVEAVNPGKAAEPILPVNIRGPLPASRPGADQCQAGRAALPRRPPGRDPQLVDRLEQLVGPVRVALDQAELGAPGSGRDAGTRAAGTGRSPRASASKKRLRSDRGTSPAGRPGRCPDPSSAGRRRSARSRARRRPTRTAGVATGSAGRPAWPAGRIPLVGAEHDPQCPLLGGRHERAGP